MRNTLAKGTWIFLICCFVLISPFQVMAAGVQRVYDLGELLTQDQVSSLEEAIALMQTKIHMDIVIVTTNDAKNKKARAYADDFYDQNGFGTGLDHSGVLFLIDMDNREVYISTSGRMINYLTDARLAAILNPAREKLSNNKDYFGAMVEFLAGVQKFAGTGDVGGNVEPEIYNNNQQSNEGSASYSNTVSGRQGLIFAGVSVVVAALVCFGVIGKYRLRLFTYNYPFRQKSTLTLTRQEDTFVNQTLKTRHIPKKTPSSSGTSSSNGSSHGKSTTHHSNSGRVHGGSGRKF